MAEKSTFGIDAKIVEKLDFDLAIKRISFDIKSDFILAPHLSCVYLDSSAELINDVRSLVLSGHFAPQLPMLIDVPKRQRIKPFGIKRLTPNLVRSGGILFPRDRVLMQVLADRAQPIIETKLDRTVCFSHQPDEAHTERMFKSSRACWSEMQNRLRFLSTGGHQVVLRADIANCFQSINQHTLVNTLEAAGYPSGLIKPLESMLTQMSSSRSSRGILQGICPSDLLGNFYMYPIDRHFANAGIDVVRYVDDIYAFFKTHDGCVRSVIDLYRELRKLDLDLNEAKSSITTPVGLLTTDPDLDAMFDAAIAEIEIDEKVQAGYGFQGIWEEDEGEMEFEEQSIELQATTRLFDQITEYPDQIEDIERFCLPIFSAFQSDYAIDHVLAKLESTPSMSQIYFSYLSSFLHEIRVTNKICSVFKEQRLMFEWEYMWLIGCLVQLKHTDDSVVAALLQFSKTNVHDAVKALALIATVKLGDFHRQKAVVEAISTFQSTYLRGAILFSARYMHKALRKNTLDLLEHQDTYLRLIAVSVRKHSKS